MKETQFWSNKIITKYAIKKKKITEYILFLNFKARCLQFKEGAKGNTHWNKEEIQYQQ